jgi:hypothetical protein
MMATPSASIPTNSSPIEVSSPSRLREVTNVMPTIMTKALSAPPSSRLPPSR